MYVLLLGTVWFSVLRGNQIKAIGNRGFSDALQAGGMSGYIVSQARTLVYLSDDGNNVVPARLQSILENHYTAWWPLLKIMLPGMFCAIVAPAMMMWRTPLLSLVFPGHSNVGEVDLNEAIACFLTPAGMVYAIFFGFCYSGVNDRMKLINTLIAEETSSVNLILRLSYSISDAVLPATSKRLIAQVCRQSICQLIEDIYESSSTSRWKPCPQMLPGLDAITPMLLGAEENLSHLTTKSKITWECIRQMLLCIRENGFHVQKRRAELRRVTKPAEWLFLLTLGCCAFFGIMLVDAKTPQMNLVMCFLTATTIIVLMLFVADMDDVTRGLFGVDVSSITAAYHVAERHFEHSGGDLSEDPPDPDTLERLIGNELEKLGVPKPAAWAFVSVDKGSQGETSDNPTFDPEDTDKRED